MSESAAQYISELEEILHSYTTIFLVFDIVFFIMLLAGVILLIHFAKSKKKLKESTNIFCLRFKGWKKRGDATSRHCGTEYPLLQVLVREYGCKKKSSSDSGFSFKISFPSPFYELQPCPT